MAQYQLEPNDVNNLLYFLGKLSYSGENQFAEVEAIQRIRLALTSPVELKSVTTGGMTNELL
jgi:hypothetical protein